MKIYAWSGTNYNSRLAHAEKKQKNVLCFNVLIQISIIYVKYSCVLMELKWI